MKRVAVIVAGWIVLAPAAPSWAAADKTHQQMMAEIRMLQEQTQQLMLLLGNLTDAVKIVTGKLDDQAGATRKGFADQKVLVDGIAEGVRILREKADDTNVRLATMTQELETLRQTVASLRASAAAAPQGGLTEPPLTPPTGNVPPPDVSPQKAYDAAFNDYTGGQYDLAIAGFEFYLKTFPTSPRAGDAQLNIGNSYYALGNYRDAAAAFQKVISDYPSSQAVPQAYYKMGLSYEQLKQPDLARRAYETVIKEHPASLDAQLARQRLDSLNKKE